eukprot:scaffold8997_cov116-Isochrysis_galbana.AAC.4
MACTPSRIPCSMQRTCSAHIHVGEVISPTYWVLQGACLPHQGGAGGCARPVRGVVHLQRHLVAGRVPAAPGWCWWVCPPRPRCCTPATPPGGQPRCRCRTCRRRRCGCAAWFLLFLDTIHCECSWRWHPRWSPIKDPGSKSLLSHESKSLRHQRLSTYDVTNGKRLAWVPTASASGLRSRKA